MRQTVSLGAQDFTYIRENNCFLVDKAEKKQIQDKYYISELEARGIKQERIRCYGFAFRGKKVLIG